jgi:hypothetical protein
MINMSDEQVLSLYHLIKDSEEPMIGHEQRFAFELLVDMADKGNQEAIQALLSLKRAPFLHPHLREMIDGIAHRPQNDQLSTLEGQGNKGVPLEYQVMVHAATFGKEQSADATAQWIASLRNGSCDQCPTREYRRNKDSHKC